MQNNYLTIEQFCEKHKAFKIGGIRGWIFHETENGLKESSAIIRVGRKLLLDEALFLDWVKAHGGS